MKIIRLDKKIDGEKLEQLLKPAVKAIKEGGLVIIPTETVYGIAADCFNISAVNKIFLVKNRPYSDPLIVHISEYSQMLQLVKHCPDDVKKIVDTFWPGPLTLVLTKNENVPDIVTAGRNTVAIRMPEDNIARKFIDMCGKPLVVPSANIFSRVPAVKIEHIIKDFKNEKEIKYVIYTGQTKYGVESTVIDCTEYPYKVLRYGAIPVEEIVKKTKIKIVETKKCLVKKSPGMYKGHYMPTKPAFVVSNPIKFLQAHKNELKNYVLICKTTTKNKIKNKYKNQLQIIHYGDNIEDIAKNLYLCLHLADSFASAKYIIIEPVKPVGLGKTVMDRITKATKGKVLV